MDRLVIFTSHYPYGNGEPFLEEELRIAESRFNDILIVTYAKHEEALTRYIPTNAKVIHLRKDGDRKQKLYEAFVLLKSIFSVKTWRETVSGVKERGANKLLTVIKTLLLFNRHIGYIKKNEKHWTDGNPVRTVYYSYWLNAAAVYLAEKKRLLSGVCICRAHGGDCFFDREYVPWRKDVIDKLDKVFSISSGGKDDLIFHYEKQVNNIEDKIDVARLGVAIPGSVDKASSSEEKIIVTCSNVIPLKRLDLLIHALADKCIRHHIRWIHFGDGSRFEEISEMAKQYLSHSEYVTYEFKGRMSKEDIFSFYRENDVSLFINCSDVEGIPVSIMEAMSYGIPALARDVGCNRELVNDTCGVLLPAKITPKDLAFSMNHILDESEETASKKRIAAQDMVSRNYNSVQNYQAFFDRLEKMLREKVNE